MDWFNSVDATYRADLRELNELNFGRFDAKLEQRVAETNARMDKGFAEANARMDKLFAEANARMNTGFAEADARIERRFNDSRNWMVGLWVATMAAILLK